MANFTITVSNNIYTLGPDLCTPSIWGTFQWGGKWEYSTTGSIVDIVKIVTNVVAPTDDYFFASEKRIDNSITPSDLDTYYLETTKGIVNTLDVAFALSDETLTNGTWNYIFKRPSTNAQDRNLATFTTQSNAQTTWTSAAVASSTWS